jgi:hypothetical protein
MYKHYSRLFVRLLPALSICLLSTLFEVKISFGNTPADNNKSQAGNISAEEILKTADVFRSPWPDFSMTATISFNKGNVEERDIFRVFVKNHVKTLVSYIEPQKQRGNMLLMVDDNLWYYVNKTQRPMRITPLQRLSGGASYGDITKLDWSRDYSAVLDGQTITEVKGNAFDTWFLRLTAKSRSATYHTIDLYIEKATGYPRKAVVYLQSGKKMKTLYFTGYTVNAGKMMNSRIDFIDHLAGDKETALSFSRVTVKKLPDSYFLNTSLPSLYSDVVF